VTTGTVAVLAGKSRRRDLVIEGIVLLNPRVFFSPRKIQNRHQSLFQMHSGYLGEIEDPSLGPRQTNGNSSTGFFSLRFHGSIGISTATGTNGRLLCFPIPRIAIKTSQGIPSVIETASSGNPVGSTRVIHPSTSISWRSLVGIMIVIFHPFPHVPCKVAHTPNVVSLRF
jgi:hypothetical protein